MTASSRSSSRMPVRISRSSPPRNSTPCGMTVATMPPRSEHGEHVLHEHEVGLLAALGAEAEAEALLELQAVSRVVLRERRVGDDAVEAHELAALECAAARRACRSFANVGVGDAVQQHVHLADRPDAAVGLLPVEPQVLRVAAVLVDVLLRQDQHAARARAGVVDRHALVWARRCAPSSGPPSGACRTRRPSCRPSRRTRRSGTRRRRRAGRGTRSPRCAAGTCEKCVIRSRSFLSGIFDWPTLRVKSMCPTTPSRLVLASSSAPSALLSPSPTFWCTSSRR